MNRPENETSSDYELIPTIEEYDSLLNNMNKEASYNFNNDMDQTNDEITFLDENLGELPTKKRFKFSPLLILYRLTDCLILLYLLIVGIFFFVGYGLLILDIVVSLYSVILMSYIFFFSSIVSYTMAPIYDCLSGNWLNFTFSILQVVLAFPLIAFYILYIIKSVVVFAEFFKSTPQLLQNFFSAFLLLFKDKFFSFFSKFLECQYEFIIDCDDFKEIVLLFSVIFLVVFIFSSGLAYVIFFLNKAVIALGMFFFIPNTIAILFTLSPSYIYFILTLCNVKCKEIKYIYIILKEVKGLMINSSDDVIGNKFNKSEDVKILDDSSISEFNDNFDKSLDKCREVQDVILNLIGADQYLPLHQYSTSIALDRHKQHRKKNCMIFFLILNLIVISYDIYQLVKDYSDYLLSSIIIRFILIPLFSYYNIITVLYHKAKNKTIRIINYISIVFTGFIILVIIFGYVFSYIYGSKYRINNLEYVKPFNNITIANKDMIIHPICEYKIFNNSAFDAFGYALGGYDVNRNKTVFDNQMKIFFGEKYESYISYKVYDIDKNFFFMKYFDSSTNSHIFAFRGYNSGPEIAFQFELFVSMYVIPFFEDIVPFYDVINDNWLSFYTDFLNSFGLRFFKNRNLIVQYVKKITDIYNKENINDEEKVYFTGINCGGVIAKIVGTLLHRKSISFISFPMDMNFLEHLFHYSSTYMSYVTNVFNIDGFFSHPDSDHAVNIGIDTPIFYKSKFCTSDFCDMFSKIDNIYRTFCTMSEMCGKGNQFKYYCETIIGEKNLNIIRENLQEND